MSDASKVSVLDLYHRQVSRSYETDGLPTTRVEPPTPFHPSGRTVLNAFHPIPVPHPALLPSVGDVAAVVVAATKWIVGELDAADTKDGADAPCSAAAHRESAREIAWVLGAWARGLAGGGVEGGTET